MKADPRIAAIEADMKAMQAALFDLLTCHQEMQSLIDVLRRPMLERLAREAVRKPKGYPRSSQNQALSNLERASQNSSAEQGVGAPKPGLTDVQSLKRRDP